MKLIYKSAALTAAAVLGCCVLTGCGGGNNIAEEDLPYGSTMRESKTTYSLPVTYDRRFLTEEQLTAVTDYLSSIQNKDAALYEEYTLGFYNDYQLTEMYSEDYTDLQALVDGIHAGISSSLGADFQFTMITIDEFTEERVSSGLDTILEILETIDPETEFVSTVDNCWAIEMEWIVTYEGGSAVLEGQKLFLLEIDGKYYCQM